MAYTTATLTGTYLKTDGTPAEGTIEIIPNSSHLVDAVGDVILAGRVKVTLDGTGSFTVVLPSTDDATVEPATGRQYTVVAKLRHTHLAAITGVDLPGGTTVDVADVASLPVVDPTVTLAATPAQLAALEAALAAEIATKQPAGDYATNTALAAKANTSDITALDGRVDTVEAILPTKADVTALAAKQDTATLDTATAGRINDPASATATALSATFVQPGSLGDRLRKAAAAAAARNLDTMASPPTITTGTSALDATLTKVYSAATGGYSAYRVTGGTAMQSTGAFSGFVVAPVVTTPSGSGGNTAGVGSKQSYFFTVDFETDAPKVQLHTNGSSAKYMVEVDGQPVSSTGLTLAATGGHCWALLDFGTSKVRRIRVRLQANMAFADVAVGATYTIWKPRSDTGIRVATVGDSISAGTGALIPGNSWQNAAARILGWTDVRQVSWGGSGFVAAPAGTNTFGSALRVSDTVATVPDLLIICASGNDDSQAGLQAAALAAFQAYRTALPTTPIVVLGAFGASTGPSATRIATDNTVQAAFDQWADDNSWWVENVNDPRGSWETGTGFVGATAGNGNRDRYGVDTAHPNDAGHLYVGARFADAFRETVLNAIP